MVPPELYANRTPVLGCLPSRCLPAYFTTGIAARLPEHFPPRQTISSVVVACNATPQSLSSASANIDSGALTTDDTLTLPPSICIILSLQPQSSLIAALEALRCEIQKLPHTHASYPRGLVRLEVPLPRSYHALTWLRGQSSAEQASSLLHPRVYFSPRQSSAPETSGSTAAAAASAGVSSTAGAGAAWLWKGEHCTAFDDDVLRHMRRFLATEHPRVRAFGGSRFDPSALPSAEWEEFGSFMFVLPRIELTECAGASILACNVAWDAEHASSDGRAVSSVGFASLDAAVMDAAAALNVVRPPALPSAPALRFSRGDVEHTPSRDEWERRLDEIYEHLQPVDILEGEAGVNSASSPLKLDPNAALDEYMRNGQQGLDDLLDALQGGSQAVVSPLRDSNGSTVDSLQSIKHGEGNNNTPHDDADASTASAPKARRGGTRGEGGLTKVVLARKTEMRIHGVIDPLALLQALQDRDPRAYQVMLQLPSGTTFLASTPERLYARTGQDVASEAVAGTRARGPGGDVEKDFWLSFDLLRSPKDDVEFSVVRDWLQGALGALCQDVTVEVAKSVLKQGAVQHLYSKLAGKLLPGMGDAALLNALHPTPAVCGQPRSKALDVLHAVEPFDRGYYAGPFGWIAQDAAEFVVAIRSALLTPCGRPDGSLDASASAPTSVRNSGVLSVRSAEAKNNLQQGVTSATYPPSAAPLSPAHVGRATVTTGVSLYAGVGIVSGSDTASEWAELDLKASQFERLLLPAPQAPDAPNLPSLWCRLAVEELCRLGCNTFCVAPGSRSSSLTTAIAQHPRTRIVPCIDERSLGFWALGHGRARGTPAVIVTSSGTAVANLLPAVVEASQSGVPLLLLTADRPSELRDTGANQTIDQVGIFGCYVRWQCDVQPPTDAVPARTMLTTIDTAIHRCMGGSGGGGSGPVHLNCQFREPLAPSLQDWSRECLRGLERWQASNEPFTSIAASAGNVADMALFDVGLSLVGRDSLMVPDHGLQAALSAIQQSDRGLILMGELIDPVDIAAAVRINQRLRWPVVADVLSGTRLGALPPAQGSSFALLSHFDHVLLDQASWRHLKPDVVLQIGGHVTSKRVCQFIEWCAAGGDDNSESSIPSDAYEQSGVGSTAMQTRWIFVDRSPHRHDQAHLVGHRIQCPVAWFLTHLERRCMETPTSGPMQHQQQQLNRSGYNDALSENSAQSMYSLLLARLDAAACAAIDAAVAEFGDELTEPGIARLLSQELPHGEGVFIGNSMPIRDLDMYGMPAAGPRQQQADADRCVAARADSNGHSRINGLDSSNGKTNGFASARDAEEECVDAEEKGVAMLLPQGHVASGMGAAVGANRGASGIDGVLSTAAGFADGLGRGTTLVVGDLSFLHDTNGLALLRSGEARPPLTVLLINNSGGGIFSFLPIADAVPNDLFTPLWATPQNVDLAGLCRAHGVPHIAVSTTHELRTALHSSWGLNRHSVIEAVTSRATNVDRHRQIQAVVKTAINKELERMLVGRATLLDDGMTPVVNGSAVGAASEGCWHVRDVQCQLIYHELKMPTTSVDAQQQSNDARRRQGLLLRLRIANHQGHIMEGSGEVSPLPGLHRETLAEAEAQLSFLVRRLAGKTLPPSLTKLDGGRFDAWIRNELLLEPSDVCPSVRFGLESAILTALAAARGVTLASLLLRAQTVNSNVDGENIPGEANDGVAVNALFDPSQCIKHLAPTAHDEKSTHDSIIMRDAWLADVAQQAKQIVTNGKYNCIKVKVGRQLGPLEDAKLLFAIRNAVGDHVVLRADANRAWTLDQAAVFARNVTEARLEYCEEPLVDPSQLSELHRQTQLPLALDETIDEGRLDDLISKPSSASSSKQAEADRGRAVVLPDGIVAVVLKPSVLGGVERTLELANAAATVGIFPVISSAFELPLGLLTLANIAAAIDAEASTYHGLATGEWLHFQQQSDMGEKGADALNMARPRPMQLCRHGNSASCRGQPRSSVLKAALPVGHALQQVQAFLWANNDDTVGSTPAVSLFSKDRWEVSVPGGLEARFQVLVTEVTSSEHGQSIDERTQAPCELTPLNSSNNADVAPSSLPPVVFLHGFLGEASDWQDLMHTVTAVTGRRCIALDLPGHGLYSRVVHAADAPEHQNAEEQLDGKTAAANAREHGNERYSLEAAAASLEALIRARPELSKCVLVGYSLGARLTLLVEARSPELVSGVVALSGSAGIEDGVQRRDRAAIDDARADSLRRDGLKTFVDRWYRAPMWSSLRNHPAFFHVSTRRSCQGDDDGSRVRRLANAIAAMSPGRAPAVAEALEAHVCNGKLPPTLLVAGSLDDTYVHHAERLKERLKSVGGRVETAVVADAGHAVSVERPLAVLRLLVEFLGKLPLAS